MVNLAGEGVDIQGDRIVSLKICLNPWVQAANRWERRNAFHHRRNGLNQALRASISRERIARAIRPGCKRVVNYDGITVLSDSLAEIAIPHRLSRYRCL